MQGSQRFYFFMLLSSALFTSCISLQGSLEPMDLIDEDEEYLIDLHKEMYREAIIKKDEGTMRDFIAYYGPHFYRHHALYAAVTEGAESSLKILLEDEPLNDVANTFERTYLYRAITTGSLPCVKTLVYSDAPKPTNEKDILCLLERVLKTGNIHVLKFLVLKNYIDGEHITANHIDTLTSKEGKSLLRTLKMQWLTTGRDKKNRKRKQSEEPRGEICAVCHDTLGKQKTKEKEFSCGHEKNIHLACLAQWLETSPVKNCPLCRSHSLKHPAPAPSRILRRARHTARSPNPLLRRRGAYPPFHRVGGIHGHASLLLPF